MQAPDPRLDIVDNDTPFEFLQYDKMAPGRRFYDVVVVKASYQLSHAGLTFADQQAPIACADDYWDLEAPERSSLKQAGDVVLGKPTTDVIVTGFARPPGGREAPFWEASVEARRAQTKLVSSRARITGPRFWRHGPWGWELTQPAATAAVPVRYELAYGGAFAAAEEWRVFETNPCGLGFIDPQSVDERYDYPAPQWEDPQSPVRDMNRPVQVVGFGPIARPWASRLAFAGTYDEEWERRTRDEIRAGLPADYPQDFDPRFFQCAHPSLVAPCFLEGADELTLTGLFATDAAVSFRLPAIEIVARLLNGAGDEHERGLALDTVHIDLDSALVNLSWRLTLDQAHDIQAAKIFQKDLS